MLNIPDAKWTIGQVIVWLVPANVGGQQPQ